MKYIFCFVGPSCSGKSHLTELLVKNFPKHFGMIQNYTSRPRRPSESERSDYVHVSAKDIIDMREAGLLLNYVNYEGVHYGLDLSHGLEMLDSGISPVVAVEPSGPVQLKETLKRRMDVSVITTLLEPTRELVVERWLNRVKEGGDIPTITKRIIKTFDDEFKWRESVYRDFSICGQEPEDLFELALTFIAMRKGLVLRNLSNEAKVALL